MAINLKIASVVIATLAITFSSFTLVRLSMNPGEAEGQKIDNGGMVSRKEETGPEPWAAFKTSTTVSPTTPPPVFTSSKHDKFYAKLNRNPTVAEKIIGIVVAFVSIVTAFMVFGAVSDDNEHNQIKRHMVTPFVIYHALLTLFHVFALVYVCVKYRDHFDVLLFPVLIYISLIFVTTIGISFVGAYHKSLSRMAGFSYAQMDDVQQKQMCDNEVKIPLA